MFTAFISLFRRDSFLVIMSYKQYKKLRQGNPLADQRKKKSFKIWDYLVRNLNTEILFNFSCTTYVMYVYKISVARAIRIVIHRFCRSQCDADSCSSAVCICLHCVTTGAIFYLQTELLLLIGLYCIGKP